MTCTGKGWGIEKVSQIGSALQFSRYSLFLILVVFSTLFTALSATDARADLNNCATLRHNAPWQFLGPLIGCFTAPDPQMKPTDPLGTQYGAATAQTGLIPAATINFMNSVKVYFLPAVSGMAIFLLSWFGLKLMNGDVQNLKGDSFAVLLKIAGVFFFIDAAPSLYNTLLVIMTSLNAIMGQAVATAAGPVFCINGDLWQSFDCLMAFLAIVTGVGLVGIILLIIFTAGTGIIILFAFVYLVFTLFWTVARFVQVYIMAVMALSLMFALGYVFVPLLLFKNTFHYFQKWLAICLAYVLIPVLMYGYMGMMFVAMDTSVISGKYSIFHEIFGQAKVSAMDPKNPATNPSESIKCPAPGETNNGTGCNRHSHIYAYYGKDDVMNNPNTPTDGGSVGAMTSNGVSGMQYNSRYHSTQSPMSADSNGADLTYMANQQGENKTPQQHLFDIIVSILVAALLAYIMYSLLSYIPDLASDLVSQGTSAGKNVVKAEVFGEAVTKFALELAKEAALAFATGGASAGATAARKGGEMAAKKVAEKAAEKATEGSGGDDKKDG